jgi:hypothetical protein
MDKLEHYLDQVCRGIGGPRELRQHVRQELREHLLDAAAEYRTAGLSPDEALNRALADFGGPEQVRSELEATHGHRLMAVMIDRAMQWKEKTMKAKWLWMTWAYLATMAVIALDVFFLTFCGLFLLPKLQRIRSDGWLDYEPQMREGVMRWLSSFLDWLHWVGNHATLLLMTAALGWGLFEWRVRSENKPFMRLSFLGTAAVGLTLALGITLGALVLPFMMGFPPLVRMQQPVAVEQIDIIDSSIKAVEQALPKKDWKEMQEQTSRVSRAMARLEYSLPALRSQGVTFDDLREHLKSAKAQFEKVERTIEQKNADLLPAAIQKFNDSFQSVREAAAKLKK